MLALLVLAAAGAAVADPAGNKPRPKASSFAPHHTKSHVYGTPISKPILHHRKKPAPRRPASQPGTPIK